MKNDNRSAERKAAITLINDAVAAAGSKTRLAALLGVDKSTVTQWSQGQHFPNWGHAEAMRRLIVEKGTPPRPLRRKLAVAGLFASLLWYDAVILSATGKPLEAAPSPTPVQPTIEQLGPAKL